MTRINIAHTLLSDLDYGEALFCAPTQAKNWDVEDFVSDATIRWLAASREMTHHEVVEALRPLHWKDLEVVETVRVLPGEVKPSKWRGIRQLVRTGRSSSTIPWDIRSPNWEERLIAERLWLHAGWVMRALQVSVPAELIFPHCPEGLDDPTNIHALTGRWSNVGSYTERVIDVIRHCHGNKFGWHFTQTTGIHVARWALDHNPYRQVSIRLPGGEVWRGDLLTLVLNGDITDADVSPGAGVRRVLRAAAQRCRDRLAAEAADQVACLLPEGAKKINLPETWRELTTKAALLQAAAEMDNCLDKDQWPVQIGIGELRVWVIQTEEGPMALGINPTTLKVVSLQGVANEEPSSGLHKRLLETIRSQLKD